jgi:hypothetical protein
MFHPPHLHVTALPLRATGPSFDHIFKICTVRLTQSTMEISDCGIAASADNFDRGEKIWYGVEISREFRFFSTYTRSRESNQVLILLAGLETSDFYCQTEKLAKLARLVSDSLRTFAHGNAKHARSGSLQPMRFP